MSTSQTSIFDFSILLAPISRKAPAGKNLREDNTLLPLYQQLKDTRANLRMQERQQIQNGEKIVRPDWHIVQDMAIDILSTKSKDLEVATWLLEALLRQQGFPGLHAGFSFLKQLCEQFWDNLYPLPDEDGLITKVAPLAGLNGGEVEGALITPIALTHLTPENATKPIALWQYRQALELLKISDPEKRAQRIASGNTSLEFIEQALTALPTETLNTQRKILQACIQEYQQLSQLLKQKCGEYTPPSSRILHQLNDCLDCLNCIDTTPAVENIAVDTVANSATTIEATMNQPATPILTTNPTISREQVLQNILQAAEFFRRTEPHSPVSYLLERTVRWAKTPLPELLKELIFDETARSQLSHLTGIDFE